MRGRKHNRRCPECRCKQLVFNSKKGELTCTDCNLVLEDQTTDSNNLPPSKFNRTFEFNADRGLSTRIGFFKGSKLPSQKIAQIYRISRIQNRIAFSDRKLRGLSIALNEVQRASSLLQLPSAVQKGAALFYRIARKNKMTNGRKMEITVAAAIYLACKVHGYPISLEKICKTTDTEIKITRRIFSNLRRAINVPIVSEEPAQQLLRILSKVKLEKKIEQKATRIFNKYIITYGGRPGSIAAASIYLAAQGQITQQEIAKIAGVTENTVRNCCRKGV